ncbi:Phosphoribosylformylglycinamidine synthase subunit PurL [Symmachiella dynata]|uniref:Phosphoribosylformylglycinamidine synthase subunit PurL n=2 Tax=Symmachiella dynata TaxID=2527995 RepID=A0A517ZH51_9PLAN|nr:phosphoribosylformylglycinamidine synthase subunit PurL [Symmachiella dynata]QDU41800.1 Phosphoribosylformylglycinamidine synthase subunit PurL [Symmachiella dynata]
MTMLWEVEIEPADGQVDREGNRVLQECRVLGSNSVSNVRTARSFLIQGELDSDSVNRVAESLLADTVVETFRVHRLDGADGTMCGGAKLLNVLYKPGVTDNIANSAQKAMSGLGFDTEAVRTCRKYWLNENADDAEITRVSEKILANDAIEQVIAGALRMENLGIGSEYQFDLITVPIRTMSDDDLERLSREGQLYLNLTEMQTIQAHFRELDRDATDVELETVAQTWSEHCSHKTLGGRVRYNDGKTERLFENMLKETIFAATVKIREDLGDDDWCISVFKDNAGIITFDDEQHVCFKVETHNHPSALEPYGGANTGIGGVIRDPLGTGLGAKPICNTDVFCFAPPDVSYDDLPPGVLHPKAVAQGVVAGVRDYGNRMGIPTVNGAVYFDERYLGNPLVYCGNVAMIPVGKEDKQVYPGDLIVSVGGRTGRDGIHGATFSSAELTEHSETLSGGAVQIGNPITEKMVADVILDARDQGLYTAITDCGAGGFSSAVGEMGEELGAEVWLDKAPLKYTGLSYTEIWISEAQERMVLSVPPENWQKFHDLCAAEGVEATAIGEFQDTGRLVLKYDGQQVADLSMDFLHNGRPPVIREATFVPANSSSKDLPSKVDYNSDLTQILGSLNVCSKEWVIRQYDHEVQAGSVIKPLVGVQNDGPSDAAVVRPDLQSQRGLVISCGLNPHYGDIDPYWMAASAIDEAVRNCVAVGADPTKIAVLDNFCWGNTDKPETLGSLVRAALACYDVAVAYGTPFISGKDSLYNEFSFVDEAGDKQTVAIPSTLLISALGQTDDVRKSVSMDLKQADNVLYQVGATKNELGGSHYCLVNDVKGGAVPQVDTVMAPKIFRAMHQAIHAGLIRSCHDLSEGGLAAAIAEMSFAGELGAEIWLAALGEVGRCDDDIVLLFSESNTRFVIEVPPTCQKQLESIFEGLPLTEIGIVNNGPNVMFRGIRGYGAIDMPWRDLKASWQQPLAWD